MVSSIIVFPALKTRQKTHKTREKWWTNFKFQFKVSKKIRSFKTKTVLLLVGHFFINKFVLKERRIQIKAVPGPFV